MRYQWLLFDADNTLFDYDRAEARALQSSFEQIGLPYREAHRQTYRRINEKLWEAFERGEIDQARIKGYRFQLLFEHLGVEVEAEPFGVRYLENLAQVTVMIEGAVETMGALHGRYKLAIITNGLKIVQRPRFSRSPLSPFVEPEHLIVSEEEGASKPGSRIFEIAFGRMGKPAKEAVLIIGDSLSSDIQGGLNYGIDTCWYNPGRRPRRPAVPSTYEIQTWDQLLKILE